jgi:hypothetical protein
VILLADRRELGGVMKVASRRRQASDRPALARRFATEKEARAWLRKLPPDHRFKTRYTSVISKL